MGQSLMKLAPAGSEEKKAKEIGPTIVTCYQKYLIDHPNEGNSADFYYAVCKTVEEINKKLGSTQFRVPKTTTLKRLFEKHHPMGVRNPLTQDEFQEILQEVILETGFTGSGAKDLFFYIFGVPFITLFIKPKAVPNEIFIPFVTSATVFVLAKLNKI